MIEDPRPKKSGVAKVGGDGDLEVFVADEQADVAIELERWRSLALNVLTDLGVRGAAEMSILFVTLDEIAALNEEYMGVTGPTDVLAFPIDATDTEAGSGPGSTSRGPSRVEPDASDLPLLLGDIVVCPAVAAGQFATHAGTLDDEVALLVVHGILHVMGHDHAEEDETARMRAEELRLLSKYHWNGPAPEAFRQEHPA